MYIYTPDMKRLLIIGMVFPAWDWTGTEVMGVLLNESGLFRSCSRRVARNIEYTRINTKNM